ncbi:hypothetical protein FOY61_06300 [Pseudomonas aeruginosa]|nr:hypothetical protein FOY61_06300 [Pseudomonas aeruginosa]
MKALRGKPKAKHIESELLSAVVRTATPAGCRSPVGERGRNTDFTGWPSTEGQTGSQHALEGKTMTRMIKGKEAVALVQGDVIIASNGEQRTVDVTCHLKEGFFVSYVGGGSDRFGALDLIDFPFAQPERC